MFIIECTIVINTWDVVQSPSNTCLYNVYSWPILPYVHMVKKWRPHFLWALSNGESQSRCLIQFRLQIQGPRMNPVEGTKVYVACTWDVSNRRPTYIITPRDPIIPTDQCCNSFSFSFSICMPTSISKPICMGAWSRARNAWSKGPSLMKKGRA